MGLWPNPRITDVPASPLECRPGRPLPMGEGAAPEGSGEHCPLLEVGAQFSPRLTSQSRGGGARGPVNGAHLWGRGSGVGRRVPALRPLWQESPSGWSAHAHTHLLIRHQPPALPSVQPPSIPVPSAAQEEPATKRWDFLGRPTAVRTRACHLSRPPHSFPTASWTERHL